MNYIDQTNELFFNNSELDLEKTKNIVTEALGKSDDGELFIDMNGNHNQGQLIVHADLAYEVVEIFKEIYECKFPIERMVTIDHFNCDDDSSMRQNNTSGFNYRLVSGTRKLSDHSYGRAIDINPLFNPFVKRDKVEPANAEAYIDRDNIQAGMIQRDDCVVRAFKNRGWQWGGDWKYAKDYQHFYKY